MLCLFNVMSGAVNSFETLLPHSFYILQHFNISEVIKVTTYIYKYSNVPYFCSLRPSPVDSTSSFVVTRLAAWHTSLTISLCTVTSPPETACKSVKINLRKTMNK